MEISRNRPSNAPQRPLRRLAARIHDAVPPPNTVLFGSVIWGGLMTASAVIAIWLNNGFLVANALALISLYFYGGALAFAPGLWLATLLVGRRGRVTRLIAGTVIILLATHAATSGIFALQYRVFYANWHAGFPSVVWFFQFAFTAAGAVYQYSVDSIYYHWPFTLLSFLGFGLWFARNRRPMPH